MGRLPFLLAAALACSSGLAQTYRCEGAEGRTVYSNTPCPEGKGDEIPGSRAASEAARRNAARVAAEEDASRKAMARAYWSQTVYHCTTTLGLDVYRATACPPRIGAATSSCTVAGTGQACTASVSVPIHQRVTTRAQACADIRARSLHPSVVAPVSC